MIKKQVVIKKMLVRVRYCGVVLDGCKSAKKSESEADKWHGTPGPKVSRHNCRSHAETPNGRP
jgi:hypothetical protein